MHTTVDYTSMKTEDEKEAKALADCKEWFGEERYEKIVQTFKAEKTVPTFQKFSFLLCMGGVEGYPVRVLYEHIYGKETV